MGDTVSDTAGAGRFRSLPGGSAKAVGAVSATLSSTADDARSIDALRCIPIVYAPYIEESLDDSHSSAHDEIESILDNALTKKQ